MRRLPVILAMLLAGLQVIWSQQPHFLREFIGEEYGNVRYQTCYIDAGSTIWVGTDNGLFRYADLAFTHIGDGSVTAVFQDTAGIIWVGTENGRVLQADGDQLINSDFTDVAGTRVTGFTQTGDAIWISTYGSGLWKMAGGQLSAVPLPGFPVLQDIYSIATVADTEVWLGTDEGILICREEADELSVEHINQRRGLPDQIVTALAVGPDDGVWAGTFDKGVVHIGSGGRISPLMANWDNGAVMSVLPVGDLELWIGTADNGLVRFSHAHASLQQVNLPGGRVPQVVASCIDDEGNIWLLDEFNGLYHTNRLFQSHETELENIQALLFNHSGKVFLGTPAGLYMTQGRPGRGTAQEILGGVNVLSLFQDVHQRLWVGTFGQGLYMLTPNLDQVVHYTRDDGLTDESILAITGWQQKIWLATLGGVTEIDLAKLKGGTMRLATRNYNLADGLGTNFIYTAVADGTGRIWFGTDGNGLSVLDGGELRNYMYLDSVELHSVYSIAEDPDGRIWCSTDRAGLVVFENGSLHRPVDIAGMRDIEISSIAADAHGNVLLCHENGIDMCIPHKQTVIYYEGEVGLLDFAPNLNALYRDSIGHIWIGGRHRVVEYTPLQSATRFSPRTTLTAVEVYLDPVDFTGRNTFAFGENYLTFRYRGIWHTNPQDVRFRYMVEGLDPDWKYTRERSVTYQRIPPGSYRFVVQSAVSDYFKDTGSAEYSFTIRKPLYMQLWFVALVASLLVLVLWILVRQREARLARRAEIRRQQVESQLQTLKAQINPHFLFNSFNTLVSSIEEDPPRAVEYVEKLSDFYRSILQYRERNTVRLKDELEIVRNYMFLLQTRFGDNLMLDVQVDNTQGMIVPLTLQMLIENAIKHNIISRARPLVISITQTDDDYIRVYNKVQRKQTSEASTQYGLDSIVRRYELITARPVVVEESREAFIVNIPILQENEVPHR